MPAFDLGSFHWNAFYINNCFFVQNKKMISTSPHIRAAKLFIPRVEDKSSLKCGF
jgi:hypothetical protein